MKKIKSYTIVRKKKGITIEDTLTIRQGLKLPVKIFYEARHSWRISCGKTHILIRIPFYLADLTENNVKPWARDWLEKLYERSPETLVKYLPRQYDEETNWNTIVGQYRLRIEQKAFKKESTFTLNLCKNEKEVLILTNCSDIQPFAIQLEQKIAKLFSRHFHSLIANYVSSVNEKHFGYNYDRVILRYNSSLWGSCSSKQAITLNSKLLLAPEKVIRYVIIHELAHLKVKAHNYDFWKLVGSADPDYKSSERWLKKYGAGLRY